MTLIELIRVGFIIEALKLGAPETEQRLNQRLIVRGGRFNALNADEVDHRLDDNFDKLLNVRHEDVARLFFSAIEVRREIVLPRVIHGAPADLLRLHVDHTATRDGSG